MLNDHQLRGLPSGGDEAAPHPPEEKDGDGDVAAGRNVPGLTVSADASDVDDPGDDVEHDGDNGGGAELGAAVVVGVVGVAIESVISVARRALAAR